MFTNQLVLKIRRIHQASGKTFTMDLPNLRKKPAYGALMDALQGLEQEPNSWTKSPAAEQMATADHAVVQRYLMSVITSDLGWLQDSIDVDGKIMQASEQRETLFDLASKRIAERCGRSGIIPSLNFRSLKGLATLLID